MAVDFRCDKCGRLVSVDARPGQETRCPQCQKRVIVPAGLASLPRPMVPPNSTPEDMPTPPGETPPEQPQPLREGDAVMGVMAHIMPWVISIFFHLGLGLIMAFITLFVIQKAVPKEVIFPTTFDTVDGMAVNAGDSNPNLRAAQPLRRTQSNSWAQTDASLANDSGETNQKMELLGGGASGAAGGGALAAFGLKTGGSGRGPRANFFGNRSHASHIVYVIDRSGSMLQTFDHVRRELLVSISRLDPSQQDFHVILFADGPPLEKKPERLVPATKEYKLAVAEFLQGIRAEGQTDPVPALQRAFQVLRRADSRPGKVLYLLTDGVFPDNAAVLSSIAAANRDRSVLISTFLYGHRPEKAVEVMEKIAKENGGLYQFVPEVH